MSEVKVNKISPRTNCGTVTVGDSGDSVAVSAGVPVTVNNNLTVSGDLKSAALKAADGGVIISQSGTNITLGASGDTISLASGASQTGFGRTGTVDWQTGSIKTATFTAANGEGYFANTSGGAFVMNLPAGSAGAIVSVADYSTSFGTNNLTITPNGSEKLAGNTGSAFLTTDGQSITLIFVDATKGWITVNDSEENVTISPFINATGGTITTSGNCKIHTFTGPGTFTVNTAAVCAANNVVSYLVVAGGGGGGTAYSVSPCTGNASGAGAGAGGFREVKSPVTPYTASPIDGYPSSPNRVTVSATAFPITVGAGGSAPPSNGVEAGDGNNSIFSTITSAGGGRGGPNKKNGGTGGSGGGRGGESNPGPGAAGNTPPVSPPQGQPGGSGGFSAPNYGAGGGGGAIGGGGDGSTSVSGDGGAGATTSISATPTAYAGGGGASVYGPPSQTSGGTGGGGKGGKRSPAIASESGTVNTGGGAGGGAPNGSGGAGGSGIVIIRYKFQ